MATAIPNANRNAMLNGTESRLLTAIDDPSEITGALLYGSQAGANADVNSDYDLICVLKLLSAPPRREFRLFGDVYLDVYYAPRGMLERRLRTPNISNNNFVLNGFIEGKILVDRDGALKHLSTVARSLWEKGPGLPSKRQAEFSQQQFAGACHALERCLSRAETSPENEGLFRLRCSELFSRMVYEYCHRRGLWSDSMPRLMRWAQDNCPELYLPASKYLEARSCAQLICHLSTLLGMLEKTLESLPPIGMGANHYSIGPRGRLPTKTSSLPRPAPVPLIAPVD